MNGSDSISSGGDPRATEPGRIWIQGAGELASGIAWRLIRCGYRVVMAELPRPRVVRRHVSFAEAIHSGETTVEGIRGQLVTAPPRAVGGGVVTVLVDPEALQLRRFAPAAVIDARMTKHPPQPLPAGAIPVIGLGPGFTCGYDAVFVIETHRGARLGAVLDNGSAAPNTGVPGEIGGESSGRLLRSPAAGCLEPRRQIGDLVSAQEIIGFVAGEPIVSRIAGVVRGLIHAGTELSSGEKVGDIDPRGDSVDPRLISDKALAVAGGVLEALLRLGIRPEMEIDRKG
ncbi:MAG: selenium-dependent molybdenum cofactor biosynthesis protein YqeB [bacterium]